MRNHQRCCVYGQPYPAFHFLWFVKTNLAFSVTPTCIYLTGTHWMCPLHLSHTMIVCTEKHWDVCKCSQTECFLLSTECLSWVLEDEYESWPFVITHYTLTLHCAVHLYSCMLTCEGNRVCMQPCMHKEKCMKSFLGILYSRKWRVENIVPRIE